MDESIRIVADGGSTSVKWGVIRGDAYPITLNSPPLNPLFTSREEQQSILHSTFASILSPSQVVRLAFYGASCGEYQSCDALRETLSTFFPHAQILLDSDIVAAALACWSGGCGLTAILGTGSNLGYYDGVRMHYYTPSLGYLLGDEGSGAWIGRSLLRDWLYGAMPAMLASEMESFAHKSYSFPRGLSRGAMAQYVVDRTYTYPHPNAFLASFARVLIEAPESFYRQDLLDAAMRSFAQAFGVPAKQRGHTEIRAVGSVASFCLPSLHAACREVGLHLTAVIQAPLLSLLAMG